MCYDDPFELEEVNDDFEEVPEEPDFLLPLDELLRRVEEFGKIGPDSQTSLNKNLILDEREYKLVNLSHIYSLDPFGAPNHLAYTTIAKLANALALAGVFITQK